MAEVRHSRGEAGFSLVELLVALVFTMVLMAGMASVYRASLSSFYTSGESLSSARRNRMSLDVLLDDLNQACLYLTDLVQPPSTSETWPPFLILPNMDIQGRGTEAPQTTDELYFCLDQPLPFEATLNAPTGSETHNSAGQLVFADTVPAIADKTFTLDCGSDTYAGQVRQGHWLLFKDAWEAAPITAAPTRAGKTVTVTVATSDPASAAITGSGNPGNALAKRHLNGSRALFVQWNQMVRYRIEYLNLDPGSGNGIPCLVRDQGDYSRTAFTPTQPQQILAENVTDLSVYLSANGGASWAGLASSGSKAGDIGLDAGWNLGIRTALDAQLLASGRPDFTSTRGTAHWFRSTPILVRLDVTTRTATRRSEYSAAGDALAFRTFTQSLVLVPRHSGLSMN
jgi:hypothetical protein